jgi:Zn-dependent protease with chaperone function
MTLATRRKVMRGAIVSGVLVLAVVAVLAAIGGHHSRPLEISAAITALISIAAAMVSLRCSRSRS